MLATKLRPTIARPARVPARLEDSLRPRFGCLTLLHACAGYGKTTALADTQEPGWTWYNLDVADRDPAMFVQRLCQALRVDPPSTRPAPTAEALALDVALRLQGRTATLTLDRCEPLGDAVDLGRFLGELLLLAPALALRGATRTRPALPLERLRLQDRLVEVGPSELRLQRAE